MPLPTFVAFANSAGGTQTEPSGTQQGDILLAVMNGTTTPGGPTGWQKVGADRTNGGEITNVWWNVRGSSAPSYVWTGSVDGGAVASFRGSLPSLHASAQSVAGSAVSPAVTTTVNDALIVCVYGDANSSTITAPAGTTLVTDGFFDSMATFAQSTPATTTTKTWGNTATPVGAWTIALAPPQAMPPFQNVQRPNIQWRN